MEYENISVGLLKKLICSMIVYLIGYFQYSIIWAVLPVILELLRENRLKRKKIKGDFVRNIASNEEEEILQSIGHLPAWVCFPDVERVEWLNKIIKRLWPNVNNYVHEIIKQLLQEKLNKKLEKYKLSGLVFDKLIVGTVPFRIGGIIVYENVSKDEIILDIDIMYAGDCEIMLKFSKLGGGIRDFELYGRLRIIIKPLINTLPLAGGLQIFFLNPPDIEFNLEGLAGVLELPLLNDLLKKLIVETICSVIVLPNKYPLILSKEVSTEDIKIPKPSGVLRIHVVQAKKLLKKDLTFTGNLTSDPYAVLAVGGQTFKTPVVERTARPKWDFWCEFIIEEINGVYLLISLWDEDMIQEDESLGRTKILVSELINRKSANMWLNLENVQHGQILIRSTWLTLSTNYEDLNYVLNEILLLQVSTLSSAILIVFVDSATDITNFSDVSKPTHVKIQLEKDERTTKISKRGTDPVWEEGFTFLVRNLESSYITFRVTDAKEEDILGLFSYNIKALFGEDNYQINKQTFKMMQSKSEGKIIVSMKLRVLKNSEPISEDESLPKNQTRHDSFTEAELSERWSLSLSSSGSSISDNSASIRSEILSPAKIKLTLRYSVQRQRLIVVVHHIEDLHFDETKGLYVKLYLLPERNKDTKRKTQVMRTSKNPVFDETFEFVISQDELGSKHLEVSVCEERVLKNEPIKKVVVDLDKLSLVLPHTRLFRLYTKSHGS